jgi:hypothetical protein
MTITAQPAVNGRVRQTDGTWQSVQMPLLVDVPVLWPGGGGVTLVFAIAKGDECLVHFSARCIDAWFQQGTVSNPPEFRMHNLSDGFASVGVRSQVRKFTVDPGVCRLRTDDDTAYFEFNPTAKTMNCVFPGGITLNGATIDSSGNVVSPATLTGKTQVVAGSGGTAVHLSTHVHPAGSPDTGAPVPGS